MVSLRLPLQVAGHVRMYVRMYVFGVDRAVWVDSCFVLCCFVDLSASQGEGGQDKAVCALGVLLAWCVGVVCGCDLWGVGVVCGCDLWCVGVVCGCDL